MNKISKWEEVPMFDSESAEAAYWAETKLDVRLMESSLTHSAENAESVSISLRMDPRLLGRIKRLAKGRFLNYQSMIKQWISERLEAELRENQPTQQTRVRGGGR